MKLSPIPYLLSAVALACSLSSWAQQVPIEAAPASAPAVASVPLGADQPTTTKGEETLESVVERTLLSNPEIQAKYHDFRSSLEGQAIAKAAFFPRVNAEGYAGREYESDVDGLGSRSWNRTGYTLELRQLIFDGFATRNNVMQSGYDKLSKFYDLLATSDSVSYDAVNAYIDVQRYRDLDVLARQNFRLHEETLRQISERARSGVGRGVDLEQAGGRLALAQVNLMTETGNLLDVEQRYQRITGQSAPQDLAPVPDLSNLVPAQGADFRSAIRRSPTFLSKQASVQAYESGIDAAKGAFSPQLELVAATGRDRSDPLYSSSQASRIQAVVTYNLFRGGADSARVRQAVSQSSATRDVRDYTCRNVQQELSIAWSGVQRTRQQLVYLQQHESATTKVRDAYRQQFQIGQRSLLDLLDTENELFESRRALTNGLYDLRLAQYRWLAASHNLLAAFSLDAASQQMPEENGKLQVSDEVIDRCQSALPNIDRLKPIEVRYNEGDQPPTLVPTPATGKAE